MIKIDGSEGEGGGQILRTALGLSLVTGQPFRIDNIRAGRRKPGLLRQHLTCVEAATRISNAETEGASLGSLALRFDPGTVVAGDYTFAVGSAGSAALVFQTVLPALMIGDKGSTLTLEGGTHNPFAPPFEFLQKTFLPILNRMGPRVEVELDRAGFYPAGGGRFHASIEPAQTLKPLEIMQRGNHKSTRGRVLIARLAEEVGIRQMKLLTRKLGLPEGTATLEQVASNGPGNVAMIEIEHDSGVEVFTSFGEKKTSSEVVIKALNREVRGYLKSDAPVGEHLADQLMIPIALAKAGQYRAVCASQHSKTNAETISKFLGTSIGIDERTGQEGVVISGR